MAKTNSSILYKNCKPFLYCKNSSEDVLLNFTMVRINLVEFAINNKMINSKLIQLKIKYPFSIGTLGDIIYLHQWLQPFGNYYK